MRLMNSGDFVACTAAALRRMTMSFGVAAGTIRPNHTPDS